MLKTSAPPPALPDNPRFSAGPAKKPPGWKASLLERALTGRSHRSEQGQARIARLLEQSHLLLEMPADYRLGLVPGSATGAFEMALWSLLGLKFVDVLVWDSFGERWAEDALHLLSAERVRIIRADYGQLPDLSKPDSARDILFTWNGTSAGVCLPDANWIDDKREGLTFCDATSAVFATRIEWQKLDVVTWSWQKALGGEAAHGMIALSPRALKRLESHIPPWPVPRLFKLAEGREICEKLFEGVTINTPSMLCVEDTLLALEWAEAEGGLDGLMGRIEANYQKVKEWVAQRPWIDFLAKEEASRSKMSVCLTFTLEKYGDEELKKLTRTITDFLSKEGAGFDIKNHAHAPAGLRLWCGPTVEPQDIEALLEWLDYGFERAEADELRA